MQARCPHCTAVFNTEHYGVQFCPSCGQQVDVPNGAASSSSPSTPAPSANVPPSPSSPYAPTPGFSSSGSGGGSGLPPSSPPPGDGERNGPPWEHRENGAPGAFLETLKQTVVDPLGFFSRMRTRGNLMDAIGYAWIIAAFNGLLQLPLALMGLGMGSMNHLMEQLQKSAGGTASPQQLEMLSKVAGGGMSMGFVILAIVFAPVGIIIGAAIFHLSAMICGAAKNGFETTLRVVAYSQGPSVLSAVPCIGIFGSIWMLVLYGIGIYRAQETTPTRAVMAVLLPILVCCCCCGIGIALAVASAGSLMNK